MIHNRFVITCLLCLNWLACGSDLEPEMKKLDQTPFFDLKTYFAEQVEMLNESQPKVRKQLRINEAEEEKVIEDANFSAELAVFLKSDINRPAWFDKYMVDSIYLEQRLSEIRYTAIDSSLKTRSLVVAFDSTGVDWISIDNLTSSIIAETEQYLHYDPPQGYRIDSKQRIIFSSEKEVSVRTEFTE